MYVKKKIYYDNTTGERIWDASYNQETTIDFDHDYEVVEALNTRKRETIGLLVLSDGQYAQDFAECNGYRFNPETKELEFSYPDPNEPEAPPVFQKALSEQIKDLELKTDEAIMELSMVIAMGGMG